MATRSTISLVYSDGNVKSIYCHWDGYIARNGKILQEHYNGIELVEKLISGGGLSSLGETTADCNYYARDDGEELKITEVTDIDDLNEEAYNYRFYEEYDAWYVSKDNNVSLLEDAIYE